MLDVQEVMRRYAVNDDDMVVKLTGRYKLRSALFFNTIKQTTKLT